MILPTMLLMLVGVPEFSFLLKDGRRVGTCGAGEYKQVLTCPCPDFERPKSNKAKWGWECIANTCSLSVSTIVKNTPVTWLVPMCKIQPIKAAN